MDAVLTQRCNGFEAEAVASREADIIGKPQRIALLAIADLGPICRHRICA